MLPPGVLSLAPIASRRVGPLKAGNRPWKEKNLRTLNDGEQVVEQRRWSKGRGKKKTAGGVKIGT